MAESPEHFRQLNLDGRSFLDVFDEYFRLSVTPREFRRLANINCSEIKKQKDKPHGFLSKMFLLISQSLGDRAERIGYHIVEKNNEALSLDEALNCDGEMGILIGFKITNTWTDPITVGPVANDPSAKEFREFWHNSTTLRKFVDGRVCECMAWEEEPTLAVPLKILNFILEKYYDLPESALAWKSAFFDSSQDKKLQSELNQSFSSLSTILRSLKNLPLAITNIHGISPFLRGTEPNIDQVKAVPGEKLEGNAYIPNPNGINKFTPSINIFIKMAYSTKWGNDIAAIIKLNTAFYLQIAEQLQKDFKLIAVATQDSVYVVQDKMVFRLTIVNEKLHKVLENEVTRLKNMGSSRIESTQEGRTLSAFHKTYIAELQLASSLHSFSLKCSIFPTTVQIMKLWLGSHQMSDVISDYALEMIIAAALSNVDEIEPKTALSAFRRCLKLLVNHKWISQPLFIDFESSWTAEERDELELDFIKRRPVLPAMAIITNEDRTGTKWTKDSPSPLLLKRIVGLATNSLKIIDSGLLRPIKVDIYGSIMQSSFNQYDVVFTLNRKGVTRALTSKNKNELKGLPIVDYDPYEEFFKLAGNYLSSTALVFYNKYGGDKISIKFNPDENEVPAKISRSSYHMAGDRNKLLLNRDEIVETFQLMMTDVDDLSNLMSESKVDPAALGAHPRFCQYKNANKHAEQQAERRKEALERQRNRRENAYNHIRNLGENLASDDEEEHNEALDLSVKKPKTKPRYANELMLNEWLVDIPQTLSKEWLMLPCPVGRRTLVVANRGLMTAYNKGGNIIHSFRSHISQKTSSYSILDCILTNQKFYVIDILAWNGNVYYDLPFDNRRFFLESHLEECPQMKVPTKNCKFTFEILPTVLCEKQQMEKMMNSEFKYELDGLLFYFSEVHYTAGQSPLVGWLKPFMLPTILDVQVPKKYMEGNTENLSTTEFIEQHNKKYKHVSKIAKDADDEMATHE